MSSSLNIARPLWLNRVRRLSASRSVILGYHGVARSPLRQDLSLLQVSPARFQRQVELLLESGFQFVTVARLAQLAAGREPPPGYAAISFDDGLRNNRTVALPILQQYRIPATVYVTIDYIDKTNPWIGPGGDNRMLSEDEIRELAAADWELGAHTMTHPDLSTLDYDASRREIEDSRIALENIIDGVRVETFAYPFGRYTQETVAATRDSGFVAAVTTGSGIWSPYELTRAMIGTVNPMPIILLKLTDRYEPLLHSWAIRPIRKAAKEIRHQIQTGR